MKILKIWKCEECGTEFGEVGTYYDYFDNNGKLQKACPMNRCNGVLNFIDEELK